MSLYHRETIEKLRRKRGKLGRLHAIGGNRMKKGRSGRVMERTICVEMKANG